MTNPSNKDAPQEQSSGPEFLEYTDQGPYGNAFISSHTIPKNDPVWERSGVEAPSKDLVFLRDETPHGFKGAKLRLTTKDLSADQLKVLESLNGFKRVAL
jgi:hypothetical protein